MASTAQPAGPPPPIDSVSSMEEIVQRNATRHAELIKVLSETDHAGPALKSQEPFVVDLKKQIRDSDAKMKQLERTREKERAEHASWRDSHIKRFAYKATGNRDKFEERAAKEERDWYEEVQKAHQEDQLNQNLRQQLTEAEEELQSLRDVKAVHESSQDELDNLYQAIFSGPNPQCPDEDTKEDMCNQALQDYFEAGEQLTSETQAAKLLAQAQAHLGKGLTLMNSAVQASRTDIFGGSSFNDFLEREHLHQANLQIGQATAAVRRAQQSSPNVRELPPMRLNIAKIIRDVFVDNLFAADLAYNREMKRGQAEVAHAKEFADRQHEAAQKRLTRLRTLQEIRAKNLEQSRRLLQTARQRAFERVLRGEPAEAPGGEEPQAVPATVEELPPYEP